MPTHEIVHIDRRFEGPPGGGNGGYVGGLLAERVGGIAEVSLRAPTPLETPLDLLQGEAGAWKLEVGGQRIADAKPGSVDIALPTAPSVADAREAGERLRGEHPFPGCFVCGPQRTAGDGLRILVGPLANRPIDATVWTPDSSLAGPDGSVDPRFVWAALDCPGGMAAMATSEAPMVLGRMSARIERPLDIGTECIVLGWEIRADGRKHFTGTALFDATGEPIGCAEQVWIEVAPRSP